MVSDKITSGIFLTDIIEGVLAFLPENQKKIPADKSWLHGYLYENSKKFAILNRFAFTNKGIILSQGIEDARNNLELANLLSSNPSENWKEYNIHPTLRKHFFNYGKSAFSHYQLNELKSIAEGLEHKIKKYNPKEKKRWL